MKKLLYILDRIEDELEDAEEYIDKAASCRGTDDALASTAKDIAAQEIKHAEMWHELAVREIERQKDSMKEHGQELPAAMRELWEHEHQEYIDHMGHIKHKLELLSK